MKFYIETLNDSGSGMKYNTKEDFLKEISLMIDDCIANGGTFFDAQIDSDASCFYQEDEDKNKDSIENCECRDTTKTVYDEYYETEAYYCEQCKCYMTKQECLEDCPLK
jgi:hypothetical protein